MMKVLFGLAFALLSISVAATDLPLERIKLPAGFAIELWARVENARQMALGRHDGSGHEVYAKGVRNSVGFDWEPRSGELWFTDNGRDRLGDDQADAIYRITYRGP